MLAHAQLREKRTPLKRTPLKHCLSTHDQHVVPRRYMSTRRRAVMRAYMTDSFWRGCPGHVVRTACSTGLKRRLLGRLLGPATMNRRGVRDRPPALRGRALDEVCPPLGPLHAGVGRGHVRKSRRRPASRSPHVSFFSVLLAVVTSTASYRTGRAVASVGPSRRFCPLALQPRQVFPLLHQILAPRCTPTPGGVGVGGDCDLVSVMGWARRRKKLARG